MMAIRLLVAGCSVQAHQKLTDLPQTGVAVLKILGKATSINVRKVLWTCAETATPYDREDWGSGYQPTDSEAFRKLNPNGLVPVIVDDHLVLWESNTICRYLANKHERTDLLPQSAPERALVEMWMDWQATELNHSWRYAFLALVRRSPQHADQSAIEASIGSWNAHIGMIESQLVRTGAFVAGAWFTLADVVIGLSINRWLMTPMDRPDLPAVRAYFERLHSRRGFAEHVANGIP
jgi:glutathione S-transferase